MVFYNRLRLSTKTILLTLCAAYTLCNTINANFIRSVRFQKQQACLHSTNHEETFCFVSSNMTLSYQVTGADKDQLVTSLAAIILSDCGADISADAINSVLSASGNTVPAYYPTLYASYIEKAGGLEKFFAGPSAGAGESYFKFCLCFFNQQFKLMYVIIYLSRFI